MPCPALCKAGMAGRPEIGVISSHTLETWVPAALVETSSRVTMSRHYSVVCGVVGDDMRVHIHGTTTRTPNTLLETLFQSQWVHWYLGRAPVPGLAGSGRPVGTG